MTNGANETQDNLGTSCGRLIGLARSTSEGAVDERDTRVDSWCWPPELKKLLMTNTPHEPEDRKPQQRVRIILPREVCATPEETAKLLHRAIVDAVAEVRQERAASDSTQPGHPSS